MIEINKVYNENCLDTMKRMPNNFIDLTVTSPPYDNLRDYNGYVFPFEDIAKELYRVTKDGGSVVWIVGDATINGSETGTSFKQALYFKEIGFNLHDTMIWHKNSPFPSNERYNQSFEYMFIMTKNKIKTFNLMIKQEKRRSSFVKEDSKSFNTKLYRNKDNNLKNLTDNGIKRLIKSNYNLFKVSENIWSIPTGYMVSNQDKISYNHPAIFPDILAENHLISWSNENDLIYDPFMGSGTIAKMCIANKRNWIGSEISEEYCKIIEQRIKGVQVKLF
jgi:site-specific DNA-methyltransferase (adenine-specific)